MRLSRTIWRPRTCQFIAGEPGEPVCGKPVAQRGEAYCLEHARRCYRQHPTLEVGREAA